MSESALIKDGTALGYTGPNLIKYVEERRVREEKKRKEQDEREERKLVREQKTREAELKTREAELVMQQKHEENEAKRIELELSRGANAGIPSSSENKSFIKLATYHDGEDISTYLRNFERVKIANRWTDDLSLTALINGFSGSKVSRFLDTLPNLTYVELKPLIIQGFDASIYDLQNKFRFAKQSNESMSQFVMRLNDFLSKICDIIEITEFKQLREFIMKDQILRSVDKNLADFLKENDIFHTELDVLVKSAENYQAIHGKYGNNKWKNSLSSNMQEKPNTALVPNSYSGTNNLSRNNHNKTSSGTNVGGGDRTCYSCGKAGHISRYCSVKPVNYLNSNDLVNNSKIDTKPKSGCFKCGNFDHFSKNCPKTLNRTNKTIEEKAEIVGVSLSGGESDKNNSNLPLAKGTCNSSIVTVMRDTGSSIISVRPSVVSPANIVQGQVKVRFADGEQKSVPKAKVRIESPFFKGVAEVACIQGLPFDVLVGNVPGAMCACIDIDENDKVSDHVDTECSNFICAVETRAQVKADESCRPKKVTNVGVGNIQFDLTALSTNDLINMQKSDVSIKSCWEKVDANLLTYPRFCKRNDVLIRIANSRNNLRDMLQQIVLPKEMRDRVMSLAHDTVMSGHLGVNKTKERISSHFYWPGMDKDIALFCRSCEKCQKNSINKPAKAPLINLPVINTPFSRVAIDLIGPLPKSSKGNRFGLVMIDLATKYPDAIPLKHIDSYTVAEALIEIFARVGLPREILHDQGTQFMSAVMKRFNQLLQIKSINTTPYHPMCNGSCENFNKTLKQMVRKICDDEPESWDKFLQPLLFAYREVPQCSTGFSPFELTLGYNVRGPLFLLKEKLLDNCNDPEQLPITQYVLDMRNKIRQYLDMSNANEVVSKSKQKLYYDRTTRKRNYKLGDKVLLLLPTSSNKLLAEWKGPFEVVRKLNNVDYVIRVFEKERMYHINMLKPFHEREINVNTDVENVNVIVDENLPVFDVNCNLSIKNKQKVENVLERYDDAFDENPGKILGLSYDISVDPSVKPISSLPYKIPYALKSQVKETLDKWLDTGVIRKSCSSWAAPVVIVQNKDESIRVTVDYRKINPHVNVDNFPMPDRDIVIEKLSNSKFLTKLDLTKAYLQMPLSEGSRKYTSFVTEFGQYEFCVVPFGIKFASGLCNRVISNMLNDCQGYVTSFVDDLMVYSDSLEEHLVHVKLVLEKLRNAGVTLNRKKCKFAYQEVKFLGVIVGNGSVYPDPDKVKAIREFSRPTNKKQLRSFLGLLSFYRKFVPNLSKFIVPLTEFLKKRSSDKIVWTDETIECFETATKLIADDVCLSIPKIGIQFIVQTDASQFGIGAVLAQKLDGELKPISFISRKLNKAECNYSVIEKECLAIKWAIEYFYPYLYGGKFKVRTDHAPLTWLTQNKDKNSRLMRWALNLQSYDFSIEYVKGSENFLADLMSRVP